MTAATLAALQDRICRHESRAKAAPALPVADALTPVLPNGLRRGSTVSVGGSLSLLFALLGAASEAGAWCALVGFPKVSAEALLEYGVELGRTALLPRPGLEWTTSVGTLLEAVDIVAVRPPTRASPGEVQRLAGRARTRDSILMPYATASSWQGADVRLTARAQQWDGITAAGGGRLKSRRVTVSAQGRGAYARPRQSTLWLPASGGGATRDNVIELAG